MSADPAYETARQAERAELRMHDHPADGADVAIGISQLVIARAAKVQHAPAGTRAGDGIRQHGDCDETILLAGRAVVDRPHARPGRGAPGQVMETRETAVIPPAPARDAEHAGEEGEVGNHERLLRSGVFITENTEGTEKNLCRG